MNHDIRRTVARTLRAAFCALCFAGSAVAAPALPFEVHTTTLSNGVRIVLAPDTTATVTQLTVCLDGGLGAEAAGHGGIAQVAARLLSDAVTPPSDLAALPRQATMVTSADGVCFERSVPEALLGEAIALEASRLTAPAFDDAALAGAVDAVRAERAAAQVNPPLIGISRLYRNAFPGHPYGRPLFGPAGDDAGLTADAAREHIETITSPARVVVVIAGRFDSAAALSEARARFGGLAARGATPAPAKPGAITTARDTLRMKMTASLALVGWRGPSPSDKDAVALEVLARAIATGPDSRIARNLRPQREMFTAVEGHLDVRHDATTFFCLAVPGKKAEGGRVEEQLAAVAEYLAGSALDDATLEQIRRQAEAGLLLRLHSMADRARALAFAELAEGGAERLPGRLEAIRRLTAADLKRAAATMLKPSQRVVVWVVPAEGGQP